ncbi:hypothetical protein PsalN5692_03949 (plasmid) [Piscirickettsia salmonis]|uniref:hypothetical protein n=1 Tax=Piscirickettsia salmonis TaxID=1238 RepID=UPI0012B71483|nr:hypothetical protein [Piscirickettsia salmonis]QGP52440.1 hypothetical protein PsalN5692_03949 [Piscirickettsia salmonis]
MKVTLNLGDLDVKAKGMTFEIKDGTKKFATLEVSSSGVTVNKKKVTWKKLADLLDEDKTTKKTTVKKATKKTAAKKSAAKKTAKPVAIKKTVAKKTVQPKGSKNKK